MTPALLLLAAALLCWPLHGAGTGRLSRLAPADPTPSPAAEVRVVGGLRSGADRLRNSKGPAQLRRWLLAAAAGGAVLAVVGGVTGLLAAAVATALSAWGLARAGTTDDRRLVARRHAELPGALDLIGVCLRAGQPLGAALAQVAANVDDCLGADLAVAAGLHGLGAEPLAAWTEWSADPVLAPVARCMSRTGGSGAALSRALGLLAEESRGQEAERAEVAARRVAVFVLVPLGLCFLPAFVLLGVVPTVLGIAATVLP